MKSSPSSICRLLVLIIVFLLLFVTSSASGTLSNPTLHEISSRNSHNHHHHHLDHSCGSLSSEKSRSLCIKLQRIHQHQTLPPPSPSQLDEIDPRYGVEKRLVPSGPNPLHN
ncbi:CLAVATA3/ESR (CLE)-related protein 9 [Fagus crenata]